MADNQNEIELACDQCDYVCHNAKTLSSHKTRKHPKVKYIPNELELLKQKCAEQKKQIKIQLKIIDALSKRQIENATTISKKQSENETSKIEQNSSIVIADKNIQISNAIENTSENFSQQLFSNRHDTKNDQTNLLSLKSNKTIDLISIDKNAITKEDTCIPEMTIAFYSVFNIKNGPHVYICQPPGRWTQVTNTRNSKQFRILAKGEIILKIGFTIGAVHSRRHEQHDCEYKGKSIVIDTISTAVPQDAERLFKQELRKRGLLYEARHERKKLKDTELIICKNQLEYEFYIKLYQEMVEKAQTECAQKLVAYSQKTAQNQVMDSERKHGHNNLTNNEEKVDSSTLELQIKLAELQIQLRDKSA